MRCGKYPDTFSKLRLEVGRPLPTTTAFAVPGKVSGGRLPRLVVAGFVGKPRELPLFPLPSMSACTVAMISGAVWPMMGFERCKS
jgi:hypothetical protein